MGSRRPIADSLNPGPLVIRLARKAALRPRPRSLVDRVEPETPLTLSEEVVAKLVGLGFTYGQIAAQLRIASETVRWHAKRAAGKIPGAASARDKLFMWARGATLDVLLGSGLTNEVLLASRNGTMQRMTRAPQRFAGHTPQDVGVVQMSTGLHVTSTPRE